MTGRPDIEFVNVFTPDALRMITRDMTMEDVVLQHTMFPYYGRFLPLERRQRAFQALVSMQGNYHNLLPIPTRKGNANRCLRYCPMCADWDRQVYGETYWHRTHQMIGMVACSVHGCYLMDSSIVISGKMPPMLRSAEEVIPATDMVTMACEIERCLAAYMRSLSGQRGYAVGCCCGTVPSLPHGEHEVPLHPGGAEEYQAVSF